MIYEYSLDPFFIAKKMKFELNFVCDSNKPIKYGHLHFKRW